MLLKKVGTEAEKHFERIFVYGCEEYMAPRFTSLPENLKLIDQECSDPRLRSILADEIEACLDGKYYTDDLLDTACEMNAESVNLWYHSVTQQFVDKAHHKGLAVMVYTVNALDELQALTHIGVDGIFTDYYSEAAQVVAHHIHPMS